MYKLLSAIFYVSHTIIVYCPFASNRLDYVLKEVFLNRLETGYTLTHDVEDFNQSSGIKINYSDRDLKNAIHIRPHGLLQEKEVKTVADLQVTDDAIWTKIFFQNNLKQIPFDVFAATFYLLSRYEEYLPSDKDAHGRYHHQQSMAFKHGFLELPLIEIWCEQLKKLMEQEYQCQLTSAHQYTFLSTFDVDFFYKYKYISSGRQLLKFFYALLSLRWNDMREQIYVIRGKQKDPYDTFDFITNVLKTHHVNSYWFILVQTGTKYDKNNALSYQAVAQKIISLSHSFDVGIHPSYYTHERPQKLSEEIHALKNLIKRPVIASRNHYLRMQLPGTYEALLNSGIKKDFTMCYPSVLGFRASTCKPFHFFNLNTNTPTELEVYPTSMMDVTLKHHMRLTPEGAEKKITSVISTVKKHKGYFISLWHNSNLTNQSGWKGWRDLFTKMHTLAAHDDKTDRT